MAEGKRLLQCSKVIYEEKEEEKESIVIALCSFPDYGDFAEVHDSVVLKQHRGAFGFDVFNDYYLK